jgi:hypothetical protein
MNSENDKDPTTLLQAPEGPRVNGNNNLPSIIQNLFEESESVFERGYFGEKCLESR